MSYWVTSEMALDYELTRCKACVLCAGGLNATGHDAQSWALAHGLEAAAQVGMGF